jgi:hypothetical protein
MERKQGFLFRCVDVVMELFAMSATVSHARRLRDDGDPQAARAEELADLFCRMSTRKVKKVFKTLWGNEDGQLNSVAAQVMKGDQDWLRQGRLDLGLSPDDYKTRSVAARNEARDSKSPVAAA